MHCLQVGNLDHHPALYVAAELKHLKRLGLMVGVNIITTVCGLCRPTSENLNGIPSDL